MSDHPRNASVLRLVAACGIACGLPACPEKPPGAAQQPSSADAVKTPPMERQGPVAAAAGNVVETSPAPKRPERGPLPPQRWRDLTPDAERVMVHKGTEQPFTGKYVHQKADGTYHCRRCDAPLFRSNTKFDSGTGWPSFDSAIPGAVREVSDADGARTEIVCSHCGAHLGHVFKGEGFTDKNVRHCVNSVSLDFEPAASSTASSQTSAAAYFAGGCFWGVEHYFDQVPGVISAESGYMGGKTKSPRYEDVSRHHTGHAETVKVTYDPARVSYEELARLFFEIHDPTQKNRQGPDVGSQYRSAVFVSSETERQVVDKLISELEERGYDVATEVTAAGPFWKAEDYHQDYYERQGGAPSCHVRVQRFGR